jgi:phosphoserine aminotransferase
MTGSRKHYFGSGPAALPQSVLEEVSRAVLDYNGSGISLLSIAHRDKLFTDILEEASALALELAGLSTEAYTVLWLQGGGRHQFAMVPMNFLGDNEHAGYIDSGHWAHEAMQTAEYYGHAISLASSEEDHYTHLPAWPKALPAGLKYVHLTSNNTIYGTQWAEIPECPVPMVADMSSDIFSMRRDYSRCALIYAVAQKNLGAAGVTLVIARRSLLESTARPLPDVLSYAGQMRANSLLNTPPVAAIYSCLLMLRWIRERGMDAIEQENRQKASLLYRAIDGSSIFQCPVESESRSLMNVVFTMRRREDEPAFLHYASLQNIEGIKGHRSIGGFRAALYNAVSMADVQALVDAMKSFEQNQSS